MSEKVLICQLNTKKPYLFTTGTACQIVEKEFFDNLTSLREAHADKEKAPTGVQRYVEGLLTQ